MFFSGIGFSGMYYLLTHVRRGVFLCALQLYSVVLYMVVFFSQVICNRVHHAVWVCDIG